MRPIREETIRQLELHVQNRKGIARFGHDHGLSESKLRRICKERGIERPLWQKSGKLSLVDAVWIAAVIDCEGTVTAHLVKYGTAGKRSVQIFIRVNMVNPAIPSRLFDLCGGTLRTGKTRTDNRRLQAYWNISSNGCRWLLPQIVKFMYDKRAHAVALLKILASNRRGQKMPHNKIIPILNELRRLNTKGFKGEILPLPISELR